MMGKRQEFFGNYSRIDIKNRLFWTEKWLNLTNMNCLLTIAEKSAILTMYSMYKERELWSLKR